MFCTNCGAKNDDNAKFCTECGNSLRDDETGTKEVFLKGAGNAVPPFTSPVSNGNPTFGGKTPQMNRGREHRKINIVPIIAVLLLFAAVLFGGKTILSNGGEKKLIKDFVKAEMTGDMKIILNMLPDDVLDAAAEELGMDSSKLTDQMDDAWKTAMQTVTDTFGENWSYSYDIQKIEDVSEDDIKEKEDLYSEISCDLDITKAKTVSVEITMKGKDTESSRVLDIDLIKVKGKWYLDLTGLESLLQ